MEIVSSKVHHQRLRRNIGRASLFPCIVCGEQARDWAYQYTDQEPLRDPVSGEIYSLDPQHYRPMCRRCHKIFDHGGDPREAMELRKLPKPPPRRISHEEAVEMGKKGGTQRSRRMQEDPELMERMVQNSIRNLPKEPRTCVDCGLRTTAPGMGNHLKSSGHSGYRKG